MPADSIGDGSAWSVKFYDMDVDVAQVAKDIRSGGPHFCMVHCKMAGQATALQDLLTRDEDGSESRMICAMEGQYLVAGRFGPVTHVGRRTLTADETLGVPVAG